MSELKGLVGAALVKALHALPNDEARVAWEARSVSELSPGPVCADEVILHTLDQPIHLEEDGVTLKAAAFMGSGSIGLSVARSSHCTKQDVIAHGRARVEDSIRQATGSTGTDSHREPVALVHFEAAELRAVRSEATGTRVMGVYDTALEGGLADRAHADVIAFKGKAAERKARHWMQSTAQSRLEWIKSS